MGWMGETIDSIKSIQIRQLLTQAISLGMIVTSALIIWKALMCVTGSESPVVVVLSGSMEPGFKRGDILFLHMSKDPIRAGEIVVFNVDGRDIPIVHRVIKVHERENTGEVDVLTKGDNNYGDDRLLYAEGQQWLHRHHIMGRAVGFLPYVGWVTIIMTEKPIIKYILIGALGLLVITGMSLKGGTYWVAGDEEEIRFFLMKFDFTIERDFCVSLFRYRAFIFLDAKVLSVVRDEKLSPLHIDYRSRVMRIWVTNKIDDEDANKDLSWTSVFVLEVDSVKFKLNVENFLLDEENKVAVVCCTRDRDRTMVYIVGEDMYKQVYEDTRDASPINWPLVFTCVPSLLCLH
ncbi:hypothetical protein DY000_02059821 [Brassica cretica]|uniref:Signal peptidase complex catalytic subunit SEC11 n=1 Tax=Brassica cretica TaxID=69181 RepID=A0ABQ7B450_BRACR|nr:hypothetical protein DY000_02059821 [Brassica cretica]